MKSKVKKVMIDQIMLLNSGGGRGRMKVEITIETIQGESNCYFSIPVSMPTGASMGRKSYVMQIDRPDSTRQYLLADFGINAEQISDLVRSYLSEYFLA